jgi:hypothetical protein
MARESSSIFTTIAVYESGGSITRIIKYSPTKGCTCAGSIKSDGHKISSRNVVGFVLASAKVWFIYIGGKLHM